MKVLATTVPTQCVHSQWQIEKDIVGFKIDASRPTAPLPRISALQATRPRRVCYVVTRPCDTITLFVVLSQTGAYRIRRRLSSFSLLLIQRTAIAYYATHSVGTVTLLLQQQLKHSVDFVAGAEEIKMQSTHAWRCMSRNKESSICMP